MFTLNEKQAAVVRSVARATRVTMRHQTGAVQAIIRSLVARGVLAIDADGQVSVVAGVER